MKTKFRTGGLFSKESRSVESNVILPTESFKVSLGEP